MHDRAIVGVAMIFAPLFLHIYFNNVRWRLLRSRSFTHSFYVKSAFSMIGDDLVFNLPESAVKVLLLVSFGTYCKKMAFFCII
jgi:hypothetical protein